MTKKAVQCDFCELWIHIKATVLIRLFQKKNNQDGG